VLVAVQVIINYFSCYIFIFFSIGDVSLYCTCYSLSVSFSMILSYFCLLSLFVLSFIGNMEHVVMHSLVVVYVSMVKNLTHVHPLVAVLSLYFACIV
jgi:hypothetical protein